MNSVRLLFRNIWRYGWLNLATVLAVAVATTALLSALIVGDSVRSSLRALMVERLGPIDLLLLTDRFFAPDMVSSISEVPPGVRVQTASVLPQITIEVQNQNRRQRGVFLSAWSEDPLSIADDEIVINRPLADALSVDVGDPLLIRLPESSQVPAESPLGRKEGRVRSRGGLRVKHILPVEGWGALSLAQNQQLVRNAFVSLATMQRALGTKNRVNAIVVSCPEAADHQKIAQSLGVQLRPNLADYGVTLDGVSATYERDGRESVAWQSYQLTSDRMIWDETSEQAAFSATREWNNYAVFTYLANSIGLRGGDNDVPYSTIAALPVDQLSEFATLQGSLSEFTDGHIALNEWTAADLEAEVGDTISISFFDPETTHGEFVERAEDFTLKAVLKLTTPASPYQRRRPASYDEPPTRANDPTLTPTVEGITDQASIDDWDPPFPFDQSRVRSVDDDYWENHRTTPKAFISLADGQRIWGSRFGNITSVRIQGVDADEEPTLRARVRAEFNKRKESLGFRFETVKRDAVASATGTTPFEALFLGFNFFVIAVALMLIVILLRLGIQIRARDLGMLQASGWAPVRVTRQLLAESTVVAMSGVLLGALASIGAAALTLHALRTWWLRAITTPFVSLHVKPTTMSVGILIAMLLTMAVAWWTLRQMRMIPITQLLRGASIERTVSRKDARWKIWLAVTMAGVAGALAIFGTQLNGMAQAGAFFGSGALLLAAALLYARYRVFSFRRDRRSDLSSIWKMAQQAASRNPGRSALTTGLIAAASFLIIAIAAFRLAPTDAGTGGFDLIAISDTPLFVDLNDPLERQRVVPDFPKHGTICSLRIRSGDDASCRNLFRVQRPQLLGVTREFRERYDGQATSFTWSKRGKDANGDRPSNPWNLLRPRETDDEPIPVVLDQNTAMYSLHLAGKIGEEFTIDYDRPIRFRIVGLVFNTILQGNLLIDEKEIQRLFPDAAGYRMFLIDVPNNQVDRASFALESRFADEGLDAQSTRVLLDDLLAVQNTYLSSFQSLGALGLLIGTFGVALVQLRSVLERQGELALLETLGFSQSRLGKMVILETIYLLGVGLGIGTLAALVAVGGHLFGEQANFPFSQIVLLLITIMGCAILASGLGVAAVNRVSLLKVLRREL